MKNTVPVRGREISHNVIHTVCIIACAIVSGAVGAPIAPPHVSFGDDASAAVSINYRTADEIPSLVNYGTTQNYGQSAPGVPFAAGGAYQHHVIIDDLLPGTTYFYEAEGAAGSFRTAPVTDEPFRFAVPGDIQYWEAISPDWQECSNWLADQNTKTNFWIPVGDISAKGQLQSTWDYFFRSSESLVNNSVLMPVQGNHECTIGGDAGEAFPALYQDNFYGPGNGNKQYRTLWYSFEYGSALFVVLLNHYLVEDYFPETVSLQKAWLEQLLSTNTMKWKFVFYHDPELPETWRDVFLSHPVTAIFNGHTHSHSTGSVGDSFEYTTDASFANGAQLIAVVDVSPTTVDITTHNYKTNSVYSTKTFTDNSTKAGPESASKPGKNFKVTLVRSLLQVVRNTPAGENGKLSLHNIKGNRLFASPFAGPKMSVDLKAGGFPMGIYVLKIADGSSVSTHLIIY